MDDAYMRNPKVFGSFFPCILLQFLGKVDGFKKKKEYSRENEDLCLINEKSHAFCRIICHQS